MSSLSRETIEMRVESEGSALDLSSQNLEGLDLSYLNLSDANLSKCNLSNVSFANANLTGANLTNAIIANTDFSNSYLVEAHLEKSDLAGVIFVNAHLSGAYLQDVNFAGANLRGVDLVKSDLHNLNFLGVNLENAFLNQSDLNKAILQKANLSGADLSGADLSGADLSGADLSGADLSGADLSGADLTKAKIAKTIFGQTIYDLQTVWPEDFDLSGASVTIQLNNKQEMAELAQKGVTPSDVGISRLLSGHKGTVTALAFNTTGEFLASASEDSTVKVWEIKTGKLLKTFIISPLSNWSQPQNIRSKVISSITFSLDDQFLACASPDATIRIWEVATGTNLKPLFTGYFIFALTFGIVKEALNLVSSCSDNTIKIWNTSSNYSMSTISVSDIANCLTYNPNNKVLANPDRDPNNFMYVIKLWEVENLTLLKILSGHSDFIEVIAFCSNGKKLASSSRDKSIKIWDVDSGKELKILKNKSGYGRSVAFIEDDKTLISWIWDPKNYNGLVKWWDLNTGKVLKTQAGPDGFTTVGIINPKATLLASAIGEQIFLQELR